MKVNLGGKERGLQWGLGCLERYCDAMDCDIQGVEKYLEAFKPGKNQVKAITTLILSGLQNYSELNDEIIDYNYAKLQSWLDDASQDLVQSIITDFEKSKYLGKTLLDYFDIEEPAPGAPEKKN